MALRRMPAETKLVLALLAVATVATLAGAQLVGYGFEERVEGVGVTVLAGAADAFKVQQASEVERLSSTLDALMASSELRRAFVKRDRAALLELATPVMETLRTRDRITHWYFHSPGGAGAPSRVFLRVHKPELHDDVVARITLRRAADTGELGAGLELGKTAFALRVVKPWVADGRLLGYMELAEEVHAFLGTMKRRTGDSYGLLVKRRHVDEADWAKALGPHATGWSDRLDVVLVDSDAFMADVAKDDVDLARLPDAGRFIGETERQGRTTIQGVFPVDDAAGNRVAALFVEHDFTAHHQAVREGQREALAILALLALLASLGAALLGHLLVFRPLGRMRRRLEQRAAAEAPGAPLVDPRSHDDLGRLEALLERALGRDGSDSRTPTPPP